MSDIIKKYKKIIVRNNMARLIKGIDNELPDPNNYKNKIYIGKDDKSYYSKEKQDGTYYWKELHTMSSPYEYFEQFSSYRKPDYDLTFFTSKIKDLTKDLKKIGILFFYLEWGKESLIAGHTSFIIDKMNEYLEENNYPNGHIFTSEYLLFGYSYKSKNDGIYLSHSVKNSAKDSFNQILISYFPKRTFGIQNDDDAIVINIKEKNKLQPTKNHIMFEVYIEYKNKTTKISHDDFNKVHTYITKNIGKKYIYDLREAYNSNGSITLYYTVYDDKIISFAKKFKKMKIPLLPKLKSIGIAPNNWDDVDGNKELMWSYIF